MRLTWRDVFGFNWLCQGCDRLGSRRWLDNHDCPKRDEWEAQVRAKFKPGTTYFLFGGVIARH